MTGTGWYGTLGRDLARAPGPTAPSATPWLAGVALVALLLGAGLGWAGGYQAGFLVVNQWSSAYPPLLWETLTLLADERLAVGVLALTSRRWPRLFWALVAASLVGLVVSQTIKSGIGAPRPPAILPAGSFQLLGPALVKNSFPSGHTLVAFVLTGVGLYWVRGWVGRLGLIGLAAGAGLSRVALGVHWPLDVCAGALVGLAAAGFGVHWAARRTQGLAPKVHLTLVLIAASFPLRLALGSETGLSSVALALPWIGSALLVLLAWEYRPQAGSG